MYMAIRTSFATVSLLTSTRENPWEMTLIEQGFAQDRN